MQILMHMEMLFLWYVIDRLLNIQYGTVQSSSYWLSKHSWILLIYNRKDRDSSEYMETLSYLRFNFMDIKRQKRYLHVWPEETSRCKERNRQTVRRQTERRRKRKRGRMNSMFAAVPSDIRLCGFKHQHIKFSGVSSSYCEIQSCSSMFCSFVLSQSHTFPLFLVCQHTQTYWVSEL